MLHVHALGFDYFDKFLFKEVQFSVAPGRLLHLQGGNGVGKTTLLRLLAGLMQPMKGTIYWDDAPINDDLQAYQRRLCYVGHRMGLHLELTVKENCLFDLHWQRRAVSFSSLLERFDLEKLANKPCSQLSEGQRRRVALLRIAMTDAPLWLLDEPLVGLDSAAILSLITYFKEHLASNGLIIMTSHQRLPMNFQHHEVYSL